MPFVGRPTVYCPMYSVDDDDDEDCIVGSCVVVAAADDDFVAVIWCTLHAAAVFRSRFDAVAAPNIDDPSNVDGFDSAAALVRAELAANIVVPGVDYMTNVAMTMTVSLRTTFDYENSIEPSEKETK